MSPPEKTNCQAEHFRESIQRAKALGQSNKKKRRWTQRRKQKGSGGVASSKAVRSFFYCSILNVHLKKKTKSAHVLEPL